MQPAPVAQMVAPAAEQPTSDTANEPATPTKKTDLNSLFLTPSSSSSSDSSPEEAQRARSKTKTTQTAVSPFPTTTPVQKICVGVQWVKNNQHPAGGEWKGVYEEGQRGVAILKSLHAKHAIHPGYMVQPTNLKPIVHKQTIMREVAKGTIKRKAVELEPEPEHAIEKTPTKRRLRKAKQGLTKEDSKVDAEHTETAAESLEDDDAESTRITRSSKKATSTTAVQGKTGKGKTMLQRMRAGIKTKKGIARKG